MGIEWKAIQKLTINITLINLVMSSLINTVY